MVCAYSVGDSNIGVLDLVVPTSKTYIHSGLRPVPTKEDLTLSRNDVIIFLVGNSTESKLDGCQGVVSH